MRPGTALAVLGLLAAATTGCGAGKPSGQAADGRALFTQACAGCHTLSGADSAERQGGDLLHVHLRRGVMLQFAHEMPVSRPLDRAQLEAVVDYIRTVEDRS
jgi:mono/diheme cytochrome c family protein